MLKDIFLALFLGALLGFGLTGGYFAIKKNKVANSIKTDLISSTPSISPTAIPTQTEQQGSTITHEISIESPQTQSLVSNSKITIKGSTSPNSYLIITTPIKSYFYQSDAAGNFNVDVEIDSGANIIEVNSFDSQDNSAKASILVTYSTAKI